MLYDVLQLGQFLCSRIGGSKRAVSDRIPNQAFLRGRKSVFSIPTFWIEQSDPHMPSKKSTSSTGCAGRIARSKKFLKPTAFLTTPQDTRSHPATAPMLAWLLLCCCCCCCCCCSQRLGVAHPVLRPPAARNVIRWQQCAFSITFFLQHRFCCCCCCCCRCYCALFGDSRPSATPQPRR